MSENYENQNASNWVHVDAYTRDDGTHVSEYWRRKYANPEFVNNDVYNLGGGLTCDDSFYPPNVDEYTNYLKQKLKNTTDDF